MAINKNFVIKNGVEVNTSLIVGDATLNKVGVGTTVPGYTLHVGGSRGGIGATDLTVTGIATVGTSGSTSAALSVVGVSSFQGDIHLLGSAGVSTISFDASLDKLNFADNARATFGADDDLQIFHDGSKSIIRETGTGNLVIEGTGETLASFIDDGAVELYYDNTKRLETTGFGVTIFDTLHSKQVNVSGASTFVGVTTFNGADVFIDNRLFVGGVNINGGSGGALGIDLRTRNINASGIGTITGQLGIGSIAAGAGLTVFGDVDITGLTTTNTLQVGNLGLNVTGVSTFSDDLAVGVSTLFADVSTGFVGVGTAVPGFPLEVRVDSVKRLQVDATGASVTGVVTGTSGGSFAQIKVGQSDINTITGEGGTLNLDAGDGVGGIVNVNADVNLRLNHGLDVATGVSTFKNDLNVGLTTFFVDKSTGRIGIGTNVPSAALEVGATAGTGIGVSIHENGNAGFTGIVTVGTALVAGSAKVEDLTNNRVVIAGTGGELEDSSNLTFDGSTLAVTGDETVSGKVSVGSGVTAFANGNLAVAGISTFNGNVLVGTGITIQPHGGVSIAGIVTVGGDLNVQGDIVYDEITGRNLNITGFSTFADDVNIGVSTFFADVSSGRIGIGTINPSVPLQVTTSSNDVAIFESISGDEHGAQITLKSNSASPADDDKIGVIDFNGKDDAGNNTTYAQIRSHSRDVTNGTEDGDITFHTRNNASFGERVRITSDGSTGIGTATPRDSSTLDVDGDARFSGKVAVRDGGNAGVGVTIFDNGNIIASGIVTVGSNLLVAGIATISDGVRVTGERVGINSVNATRPSAPLEIRAPSTFQTKSGHIVLSGDSATNGEGPQIVFSESGSGSSHAGAYIGHVRTSTNSIGDLVFGTRNVSGDADTVPSERMRIAANGLVGIATDNPDAFNPNADDLVIFGTGHQGLTIRSGSGHDGSIMFNDTNDANQRGIIRYDHTTDALRFHNSSGELVALDGANVGIGTTRPTAKLHIEGNSDDGDAACQLRIEDTDDTAGSGIPSIQFFAGGENSGRIRGSNSTGLSFATGNSNTDRFFLTPDGNASIAGIVTFSGTGAIHVPDGTTAQRPAGVDGYFRYNTDDNQFEGFANGSWGAIAGGGGGVSETDTSVSTTTATGVGSFAVSTHRSASIIAQIDQGGSYQVGRYLMIHDGTTATVIEESAIATGDMLGSFTADINNSNAELKVTMNSSGIATVTTKIDTVTV